MTGELRDPQLRMEKILDPGSFTPLTQRDESGMLAAYGTVSGTRVTVFATDATIQGGAMGEAGAHVILAAYADAMKHKNPIVGIWHTGGARLREGVKSLHAFGLVFNAITQASGKIPQFSLVLGPAAGGGAYGPALTDVIVLAPDGRIFVTGPDVVRSVTGESVDMARLGGPEPHGRRSGVVHIIAESEEDSFKSIQRLVRLLGDHGNSKDSAQDIDLAQFLPESNKRAYDVHPLVAGLLDSDDIQELHPKWAPNIITTLGRLDGRTIGVIANNPLRLGGCLDSSSAEKAARFVRTCDCFGVPLVVIVDVPGYLPGVGQEWDGVVRRGAKLLHAFSEAVVPRVTLITRKAYGGAYIAMNSRSLGATKVFAWPTAEVAVMGAVAAIRVLHRRILADLPEDQRAAMELELAAEHEKISGGVTRAMEIGVVDAIIEPSKSRSAIAHAFATAPARRGDHSNIQL